MSVDQRRSCPGRHRVTVLGAFGLTSDGTTVPLGPEAARLVAYLAVHRRPHLRADLAADLWPGVPAAAAARLLDEALAAVPVPDLVDAPAGEPLALGPAVDVDLDEAMALVRVLADDPAVAPDLGPDHHRTALLCADVLPGWTAAWVVVERERFRQIRLNALEELSGALTAVGRHAEAVALAEEAVRTSPSRESARRALIEAHLAQGELAEAVAQYDEYLELLRSSVGAPTAFGLEGLLPPTPAWPVLRVRRPMQRNGVQLPGLRAARGGAPRRLVAGGSIPSSR
jgi:DNA-binding SARP family transcriptional activator